MFRTVGLLIIATATCGFTSCTKEVVKEADPVNSELLLYVPVPPRLTTHGTIPNGPLSEAPRVAKERKKLLAQCYASLDEIARIQGTEAQPITCPADPGKTPDGQ